MILSFKRLKRFDSRRLPLAIVTSLLMLGVMGPSAKADSLCATERYPYGQMDGMTLSRFLSATPGRVINNFEGLGHMYCRTYQGEFVWAIGSGKGIAITVTPYRGQFQFVAYRIVYL